MSKWTVWAATAVVAGLVAVPSAAHAQFGSLKGQVIVDGDWTPLKPLFEKGKKDVRDPEVCAVVDMPNDSVVVDPKTKGLANVAVYLRKKPEKIAPGLVEPKEKTVVYDQVACRFTPRVIMVQNSQTVKVLSGDAVAHNTRGATLKPVNQPFNFTVKANDREGVIVPQFKAAENVPIEIRCDIHPWMKGFWLVVDHPYAVITGADGAFEIKDIPAGTHELRVWHEAVGYVEKSLEITIKDGQTADLKQIKASAKKLAEGAAK